MFKISLSLSQFISISLYKSYKDSLSLYKSNKLWFSFNTIPLAIGSGILSLITFIEHLLLNYYHHVQILHIVFLINYNFLH